MIKKLDLLILKAFAGPFLATLFISLFVLVMQFFWLYIDDVVGKGLDLGTILEFVGYVSLTCITLALPLALLLSSIMTFGNLGESFELVAIRSAGIPLLRFMRPLFILTVFIAGIAFLFSNNVIPIVNLKMNRLKYDIIVTKPAFDIKEGVFYDKIEGFVIKLGKKEKDDSTIRDVVIYEKNYGLQDNILVANSGVMRVTADKKFLEFLLKDGWRYSEKGSRSGGSEFTRLGFNTYKKVLDLSSFKMNETQDSLFQYDPKMLSIRQLNQAIDSLHTLDTIYYHRSQNETAPFLSFLQQKDSVSLFPKVAKPAAKNFISSLPDSLYVPLNERAQAVVNSVRSNVDMIAADFQNRHDMVTKHWIEWNRKFTLSMACIVLFMIGAPLGSIIRKGGLGTPLVFAIIFFVLFHLLNTFGEKFARENVMSPFGGMWLSTMVLVPIGIFLTAKAMNDSQLFNKEYYHRLMRRLRRPAKVASTQ